jgi:hypothetical protein
LIGELANEDDEQVDKDADAWDTKTKDIIMAGCGDGEVALFLSSSGYVLWRRVRQEQHKQRY